MAVLEVDNISKSFGGLQANAQAHLKVEPGKITALIGPNGAGKTTLFAIVSGFVIPDEGRVTFQGQDITGMQPFDICRLGLVRTFQIVQPFAGLTVRENIAVGAHLRERNRSAALDKASALAAKIGMKDMLDKPAQSLTIAGRKRLELARALATRPKLLLLDEIAGGLTEHEAQELVEELKRIKNTGVTMIWIEHVVHALLSVADRLFVVNFGQELAQGLPNEVMNDPEVKRVYMGMEV